MAMKFKTILLFGPPGAGKGTQGKVMGFIPGFFHLSCGDVFRGLTIESPLGRVFLEFSGRGELVPDAYTIRLWREVLEKHRKTGQYNPSRDILVLDGLPRNVTQAKMLRESIDVRAVFNLVCPDREKLVSRLQRRAIRENRLDDASLAVIRRRLDTYDRETQSVLEFYGNQLVHPVNALQSPVEVLRDILLSITKKS